MKQLLNYHTLKIAFISLILVMVGLHLYQQSWQVDHFPWQKFFFVTLVYLFSHCLRVIRLALLAPHHVRFRHLFQVHFYTAAVSRLVPFKLGEAYRIMCFGSLFGTLTTSIMVVWIERLFDALIIGLILAYTATIAPQLIMDYQPLILLLLSFAAMTFLIFFIFPENLSSLQTILIIRYNRPWLIHVLKFFSSIDSLIKLASPLLSKKIITLFLLSLGIWLAEISAFSLVISDSVPSPYLSALSELPGILTNNFYQHSTVTFANDFAVINTYLVITLITLLVTGSASFIFYYYKQITKQNEAAYNG